MIDPLIPLRTKDRSSPFVIIWMFAGIVLCLFLLANYGFGLLSSTRAYVSGESLWSKAQKNAAMHLQKYATNHDPQELQQFRADIAIPLGDRVARVEMNKREPDYNLVRQGFLRGGNHPDDIDGMIALYRGFQWISFMQRALRAWESGDHYIAQLDQAGMRLQLEVTAHEPSTEQIKLTLAEIAEINEDLTVVEKEFVGAMNDASRTVYRLLQAVMLAAAPGLLTLAVVLSLRILRQRKRMEERIKHMAFHDELTSLPNRLMLNARLHQALSRHRAAGSQLAILFLDVDRFKVINDSLGHETGDSLLRQVADRLSAHSREGDTIARMGGDEFVVLMENSGNIQDISTLAQRLVKDLASPYALGINSYHVTVSIGVSIFPADGGDATALLKAADVAMYRAKDTGRNSYQFYSAAMNVHTVERLELESDLRHALERDEFLLHYQPKVEVATGLITGVEALLRWNHPRRGLMQPMEFIPLAEEIGLISSIGEWVLATACARTREWQVRGFADLDVAVNLSARQFADPLLFHKLSGIIRRSGLNPPNLELEITESLVMSQGAAAVNVLQELKSLGVRIAIDDFGTGYSSLAYLKCFPIDTIKVDRRFIRDIPADSGDKNITRALIAMAHSLRLKVVAEGVETAEQLQFLRKERCDIVQGYLFYRALPEGEVAAVLKLNRMHLDSAMPIYA